VTAKSISANPIPDVQGVPLLHIAYRTCMELCDWFKKKFNKYRVSHQHMSIAL
jgi:hypothetical protein